MHLKWQTICFGDYSGMAAESHVQVTLLLEENLYRDSDPTYSVGRTKL